MGERVTVDNLFSSLREEEKYQLTWHQVLNMLHKGKYMYTVCEEFLSLPPLFNNLVLLYYGGGHVKAKQKFGIKWILLHSKIMHAYNHMPLVH